jgi:AcrR family transcriptional regulator
MWSTYTRKGELVDSQKLGRTRALLAAKHLFATQGFNETTALAIAREADVSHAFLLNQFGNKDRLLVAVLDGGWSPITRRVRALSRIQTPYRRLTRALELLFDSWLQDPEAAELMLIEGRRVREGGSIIGATAGFANCLGIFDYYVAECRTSGTWANQISNVAIRSALLALVEGVFLQRQTLHSERFSGSRYRRGSERIDLGFYQCTSPRPGLGSPFQE